MFGDYNQVYYGQSQRGGYYPEPAVHSSKTLVVDPEHDRKYPPAPKVNHSDMSGREFWVENSRSQPQAPITYPLPVLPEPGDILQIQPSDISTQEGREKDAA